MTDPATGAGAPCLGTMFFGTTVDAERSYALLDAYVERGGRMLDTANNYAAWVEGGTGDESETLLGRWLAERGVRGEIRLATKIGARNRPGGSGSEARLGLSAPAVREQLTGSLRRLGVDRVDLLYAHIDDPRTPLAETLGALDALVTEGLVGEVGCSNLTRDRLVAAHEASAAGGFVPYTALQSRFSYLVPAPDADFGVQVPLDDDLAAYAHSSGMAVYGYSALLAGAYARVDEPLPPAYRDGAEPALQALRATAADLGASLNQVVLAWMQASGVVPVLGVSREEQLAEALDGLELTLDEPTVAALTTARRAGGAAT